MLIAPIAGKAADRLGERAPIVAGFIPSPPPCAPSPPQQAGLASGVGSTLQNIGGVFGVATAVFAASGSYLTPAGFVHGLRPALLALAILDS